MDAALNIYVFTAKGEHLHTVCNIQCLHVPNVRCNKPGWLILLILQRQLYVGVFGRRRFRMQVLQMTLRKPSDVYLSHTLTKSSVSTLLRKRNWKVGQSHLHMYI